MNYQKGEKEEMLEKLYDKSPIFIQELLINGYGLKTYLERYCGKYRYYKKEYFNRDYKSYIEEEQNQLVELKKLLKHAKSKSIYYARILKNIDIEKIESLDILKEIPILEKENLRKKTEDIIISKELKSSTSGTTGKSMTVYFTKDDYKKRMAYLDAFKERFGVKLGMKVARFSGKNIIPMNTSEIKKFWRTNRIINQRVYSTFHLSEKNLKYYIDDLNKYRPKSIDGFISAIYELAKFIDINNLKLNFKPLAIFPTSETVLSHQKELVEKIFQCKVRNQYASSEGAPFITECIGGNLHYNMDTGIIEIIENGEILVTSFTTYGTPLIRYKIGDRVKLSNEICKCGSSHPVIEEISGRNTDFLYSKERGKINAANMSNVIKYIPNAIKKIQFIQDKIDEIIINIEIDKERYKEEYDNEIIKEMKNRFGEKVKFKINKLEKIKREQSGKFRYIKNNLNLDRGISL